MGQKRLEPFLGFTPVPQPQAGNCSRSSGWERLWGSRQVQVLSRALDIRCLLVHLTLISQLRKQAQRGHGREVYSWEVALSHSHSCPVVSCSDTGPLAASTHRPYCLLGGPCPACPPPAEMYSRGHRLRHFHRRHLASPPQQLSVSQRTRLSEMLGSMGDSGRDSQTQTQLESTTLTPKKASDELKPQPHWTLGLCAGAPQAVRSRRHVCPARKGPRGKAGSGSPRE